MILQYRGLLVQVWLLLATLTLIDNQVVANIPSNQVRLSGWTAVSQLWPQVQEEFFVTHTKGHHYIEVSLPRVLESDLTIRIEYYFNYAQVKPVIHLLPCDKNAYDMLQDGIQKGSWHKYEHGIPNEGCSERNKLIFNVLLHDSNDIFAWKYVQIFPQDSNPDHHTTTSVNVETTTRHSSEMTTNYFTEASTILYNETTPTSVDTMLFTNYNAETTVHNFDGTTDYINVERATTTEIPSFQNEVLNTYDYKEKRSTPILSSICKPSSCDYSLFNIAHFRPLIRGMPPLNSDDSNEGYELYLNNENETLLMAVESSDDLTQVNTCVELELYMQPGTALEFVLDEGSGHSRRLELIQRKESDSTAFQWDSFKRCIIDYIPQLNLPLDRHSLKLKFRPEPLGSSQMIAILLNQMTAAYTKKMYQIHDYLPDVSLLKDVEQVDQYWILDRDGAKKPKLKFEPTDIRINGEFTKQLHISEIDKTQESFDLMSRWIKVEDLELLGSQLFFIYKAKKANWIESIEFQYQSAAAKQDWRSETVYADSQARPIENESGSTTSPIGITTTVSSTDNATTISTITHNWQAEEQLIPLPPIKLKGLSKEEFRFRIRHILKSEARKSNGLELVINSLAFGDTCVEGTYCKNNGTCTSISATKAQCSCTAGFVGERCELSRPCEMLFGLRTGYAMCQMLGATCIDNLPVIRCRWPDDQYYTCTENPNGTMLPDEHTDANSVEAWKEKAERQSRLIIILTVFMISMMLFSAVIVINIVSRLLKSKRRLKTIQVDMIELTRRAEPSTSTGTYARSASRSKPAAVIAYNNRSFDAA